MAFSPVMARETRHRRSAGQQAFSFPRSGLQRLFAFALFPPATAVASWQRKACTRQACTLWGRIMTAHNRRHFLKLSAGALAAPALPRIAAAQATAWPSAKTDSRHCAVLGWQHHRHHRPHRSRSPVSSTRADHRGGKSRRRRRQSRLGSGRESRPRRLHTADQCRCPFRGTSRLPQPSLRCSRRFFRGRHFRQRAQCAPGRAFEGHQVFAGTGGQGERRQHELSLRPA